MINCLFFMKNNEFLCDILCLMKFGDWNIFQPICNMHYYTSLTEVLLLSEIFHSNLQIDFEN